MTVSVPLPLSVMVVVMVVATIPGIVAVGATGEARAASSESDHPIAVYGSGWSWSQTDCLWKVTCLNCLTSVCDS